MSEPTGWGSKKMVYALEQVQKLDSLMNLNSDCISRVLEIVIAEKLFDWVRTPEDVPLVVSLIETRGTTLRLFQENQATYVTVTKP